MEQRIIKEAKPGTIIVAPYDTKGKTHYAMTCARIEGPVFMTGVSQAQADHIREDAQRTSNDILRKSSSYSFDTGYWKPVIDAASWA